MAVVKTTYDFDQMLSNAREAYGEELLKMADEGLITREQYEQKKKELLG